ncbi:hypothetical protein HAX54_014937, partial [Datura stramonium]|nr:hypothetical protein [Datura stramonium]
STEALETPYAQSAAPRISFSRSIHRQIWLKFHPLSSPQSAFLFFQARPLMAPGLFGVLKPPRTKTLNSKESTVCFSFPSESGRHFQQTNNAFRPNPNWPNEQETVDPANQHPQLHFG